MLKITTDTITTAEAARILGVDIRTVHRRVERGEISVLAKLPGTTGAYLFDRATLIAESAAS